MVLRKSSILDFYKLYIPILKTGINRPDGTGNVAANVVVMN